MSRNILRLLSSALVIGGLTLAAPATTEASVIFTNFGAGFAYDVNQGNVVGDGFDGSYYAQGDTFTPAANATLGKIYIALSEVYQGSQSDPITVNLTADGGNKPGVTIESFTIAPGSLGLLGNNNPPVVLTSVLNPLLLGGTQYWLTASLPMSSAVAWNFNSTGDISAEAISQNGGPWFSPSGLTPGAYELDSQEIQAVPEPATLVLVASALAMALRRKTTRS